MELNDIIGSFGVILMLTAYILNIIDKIDDDDLSYLLLNFFGGLLSCIASCLIPYYPFVILEGVWTLVTIWGLYDYVKCLKNKNEIK